LVEEGRASRALDDGARNRPPRRGCRVIVAGIAVPARDERRSAAPGRNKDDRLRKFLFGRAGSDDVKHGVARRIPRLGE
jgi:hypothetical protein